jgi:hypothetical protein
MCDAAAIFSVGVAQCCGTLFHQYLHPGDKGLLSDSLKILIWGGREQYELTRTFRQKLLAARGRNTESAEDLELPEWNAFLQMTRNILEKPADAFKVPWLLRHVAFDILRGRQPLKEATTEDLLAVKYAMLVVEYICRASGAPKSFQEQLVSMTVRVQSDLAVARDQRAKVTAGPEQSTLSDTVATPLKIEPSSPIKDDQKEELAKSQTGRKKDTVEVDLEFPGLNT